MLKEVRASHILVKTEEEANKLREDINAGKIALKKLQDKFLFAHQVMRVEI